MKKLIQYWVMGIWLFGGLAWAQSVPEVRNEMERLEYAFQSQRLNNSQFDAFELRAGQKAQDWFEYLNAAQDTAYPQGLRLHMNQMAEEMLTGSGTLILGEPMAVFLEQLKAKKIEIKLPLEQVSWQDWQRLDGHQYLGLVELQDQKGNIWKVSMRLALKLKQFGEESSYIWVITIDSIY